MTLYYNLFKCNYVDNIYNLTIESMNNLSMIKEKRGVEKERENYSFSFNLEKAIFRYFLRKRRVGEFLIVRSREFQKEGRSVHPCYSSFIANSVYVLIP